MLFGRGLGISWGCCVVTVIRWRKHYPNCLSHRLPRVSAQLIDSMSKATTTVTMYSMFLFFFCVHSVGLQLEAQGKYLSALQWKSLGELAVIEASLFPCTGSSLHFSPWWDPALAAPRRAHASRLSPQTGGHCEKEREPVHGGMLFPGFSLSLHGPLMGRPLFSNALKGSGCQLSKWLASDALLGSSCVFKHQRYPHSVTLNNSKQSGPTHSTEPCRFALGFLRVAIEFRVHGGSL